MGRKQFEKVTVLGTVESSEVVTIDFTPAVVNVPNNTTWDIDIFSPEGTFTRVNSLILEISAIDAVTTTGAHMVDITPTTYPFGIYMRADNTPNKSIVFAHFNWEGVHTNEQPEDPAAQATTVSNMVFTDLFGLRFRYKNTSGKTRTNASGVFNLFMIAERTRTAQKV